MRIWSAATRRRFPFAPKQVSKLAVNINVRPKRRRVAALQSDSLSCLPSCFRRHPVSPKPFLRVFHFKKFLCRRAAGPLESATSFLRSWTTNGSITRLTGSKPRFLPCWKTLRWRLSTSFVFRRMADRVMSWIPMATSTFITNRGCNFTRSRR